MSDKRPKYFAIDFAEWVLETVISKHSVGYIIREPNGETAVYSIEQLYDKYLDEVGSPL